MFFLENTRVCDFSHYEVTQDYNYFLILEKGIHTDKIMCHSY